MGPRGLEIRLSEAEVENLSPQDREVLYRVYREIRDAAGPAQPEQSEFRPEPLWTEEQEIEAYSEAENRYGVCETPAPEWARPSAED